MESINQSIKSIFEQKQIRIYNNSGTAFAKEENSQSDEMWFLKSALINKQIVLVACKKDEVYCDNIKAEIRVIEKKIAVLENKQIDDIQIPF